MMIVTKITVDQLVKDNPKKRYTPVGSDFVGVLRAELSSAVHAITNAAGGWDHMTYKPERFEYPIIEDALKKMGATLGTDLTFLRNTGLRVHVYDPFGEYGSLAHLKGEVAIYKVTPLREGAR
ncbi:hypothetical protein HY496_02440 [Candidatus Woesearchaeota archaeon]|nr:hypothetical protein [Candidatus Woesearchaeota archaeon]